MKFTGDMAVIIAEAEKRMAKGEDIRGIVIDKDTGEVEFLTREQAIGAAKLAVISDMVESIGNVPLNKDKCKTCHQTGCPSHPDNSDDDDDALPKHTGHRDWN